MNRFAPLALAVVLLAACAPPRDGADAPEDAAALAAALRARYGSEPELAAELALRAYPADGERVGFSLRLSVIPEHGVILDGFEKGIAVLEGQLAPDGALTLLLVREEVAIRGDLAAAAEDPELRARDAALALLVTRLGDIVDEVQYGPVPRAERYRLVEEDGDRVLICDRGDVRVSCRLDAAGEQVTDKRIAHLDADGEAVELLRVAYDYHRVRSGLLRARKIDVTLADGTGRLLIKFSELTVPSVIEPLRATPPEIPDDWPVRPLLAWLRELTDPAPAPETP